MTMKPEDRIIMALDVPTADEALRLVDELDGLVSFFKIGLELLVGGGVGDLLTRLRDQRVFLDLKLPDDLPMTIRRVARVAADAGVKFLTLSHSAGPQTVAAAITGRGASPSPEFLSVPFVSSFGASDFTAETGRPMAAFRLALMARAGFARESGVDGFVVSGPEIHVLRTAFPNVPLVSPGIRPAWADADDHRRACTPAEAIGWGADYLVVGRPIRKAPSRRDAAKRIADEIAGATPP